MAGKGSFIFVIGFSVIMGYIILNLTELGTRATTNVSWYNAATTSKNLAAMGANVGLASIFQDYLSGDFTGNWEHKQPLTSGTYSGGTYNIEADYAQGDTILLKSVSEFPFSSSVSFKDTILVQLVVPTDYDFLSYGYLTGFSGNGQFAMVGDTMWGPIHANGGLHTHPGDPRPVFHGMVTAKQLNGPPAEFLGGIQFTDNPIEFPLDIDELMQASNKTADYDFGLNFDGSVALELMNNELHMWFSPSADGSVSGEADSVITLGSGFNGAFYTSGDLFLKGTLEGMLTAGAGNDVKIVGDVTYHNDGQGKPYTVNTVTEGGVTREILEPMGDDVLGVIAENNIEIMKNSETLDGLTMHGAFYAMDKLYVDSPNSIDTDPVLDVWGSVIVREPDGFGRIQSSNGNGFSKRFRYDERLNQAGHRPLYFPGGKKMTPRIISWWENIRIPDF